MNWGLLFSFQPTATYFFLRSVNYSKLHPAAVSATTEATSALPSMSGVPSLPHHAEFEESYYHSRLPPLVQVSAGPTLLLGSYWGASRSLAVEALVLCSQGSQSRGLRCVEGVEYFCFLLILANQDWIFVIDQLTIILGWLWDDFRMILRFS